MRLGVLLNRTLQGGIGCRRVVQQVQESVAVAVS
jgi:hypothetical protein